MADGWAGKTLQIDLTTGKVSTAPWKKEARMFLGGRGGNAWLFWKNSKRNQDPFDPDAPVIISAGGLAGTGLIGASRMEVTVVSPAKTESHSLGNVGMGSSWAPEQVRGIRQHRHQGEGGESRLCLLVHRFLGADGRLRGRGQRDL